MPQATLPVIYLRLQSPVGSSVPPSIALLGRATLCRWFTRTCSSQLAQPDDHPPAGGLLHHLLTLTCRGRRLFSSALTCCHQQLPFSEVGCPMLPGLSSRTHRASDRPGFCFHGAKLRKIESRTKRTCSFFMPRWSNLSKVTKNREQDTILSLSGQNHQNLFFYAISIQLCRHTTKKSVVL